MPRLPRFRRSKLIRSFELTERDRDIISLLHEHRFLRSSHLHDLLPGSPQQISRRLQLLYHHGYLERPRIQLEYFHEGGSKEIVYGLGNKAQKLVKGRYVGESEDVSWGEKNRAIKRVFFKHTLLVSDIMVAFTLACRKQGLRLLIEPEVVSAMTKTRRFKWRATVNGIKLTVVPDRVFAIDVPHGAGETERTYFFLEADRGTMPVVRRNLFKTSFRRKLLAYAATWSQGIHKKRFGFHRFRVLTVTTSAKRVESMLRAATALERGHGIFLFVDASVFKQPNSILGSVWRGVKRNEPSPLVNNLRAVQITADKIDIARTGC